MDVHDFSLGRAMDVEAIVNSPEAVAIVQDHWDWEALEAHFNATLDTPLTEWEADNLARDLRDWWKNGNFYVWEEGQTNDFQMGRWKMGDPDFWVAD